MLKKEGPSKALVALEVFARTEFLEEYTIGEVLDEFYKSTKSCVDLFYSWDFIFDTILYKYLDDYRDMQDELYDRVREVFCKDTL